MIQSAVLFCVKGHILITLLLQKMASLEDKEDTNYKENYYHLCTICKHIGKGKQVDFLFLLILDYIKNIWHLFLLCCITEHVSYITM